MDLEAYGREYFSDYRYAVFLKDLGIYGFTMSIFVISVLLTLGVYIHYKR